MSPWGVKCSFPFIPLLMQTRWYALCKSSLWRLMLPVTSRKLKTSTAKDKYSFAQGHWGTTQYHNGEEMYSSEAEMVKLCNPEKPGELEDQVIRNEVERWWNKLDSNRIPNQTGNLKADRNKLGCPSVSLCYHVLHTGHCLTITLWLFCLDF